MKKNEQEGQQTKDTKTAKPAKAPKAPEPAEPTETPERINPLDITKNLPVKSNSSIVQDFRRSATSKLPAADPEETKGIQAYIPMSLYERLVMRKLRTKEPLGSMFQQAMQMWIDVQEGKLKIVKP